MTRILCLWFPNWPIQRRTLRISAWVARPELPDFGELSRVAMGAGDVGKPRPSPEAQGRATRRPLVLETSDARGGRVAACCARAIEQGIYPGMPVAEAKSLVPDVIVEPHDPPADRQALQRLAEACEQFSPCVGLEEGNEPESLLLDISNLEHLWGHETELAARVEKFFTRRGYRVRLAVADTVGLAWAVAHFGEEQKSSRAVEQKSNGYRSTALLLCCSHTLLSVEALRISADTADLLRQLGIETIGQLMPLPRESLASRFGDELLRRLDQLTGAASEVIVPHRGRAPLGAHCAFEQPTADRAILTHALTQLTEQLARDLAARDEGAVLLACLLKCAQGEIVSWRIGLVEPTACARQWMELIELHLETLKLADEVTGVELRVPVAGRLGQRQGELFAGEWPNDPHQMALLINRLSSRLGSEQVVRPELRASPVPERAVRYVAATERGVRSGQRGAKKLQDANCKMQIAKLRSSNLRQSRKSRLPQPTADSRQPIATRPLLLYPEPRAVDVVSVAPNGPPEFVWHEARRERVARHWGPERIETLWWRGRSIRRDYYRVATESGDQLWIFRRLDDRRWFVHGLFS